MKQSNHRQGSVLSFSEKVSYPKCEKRKEHAKESLNYVCLTAGCKNRGLVCVMCKGGTEHAGHNVQAVKSFLIKLEETLKKSEAIHASKTGEEQSLKYSTEHSLMQKLEESHLQILSTLRIQIGEIAQRIRRIEEQIMCEYEKVRARIRSEFDKQSLIQKSVSQIRGFFEEEREKDAACDIRLSVMKLLCLVKFEKNELVIANEAESQFNAYSFSASSFKTNMLVWERETLNIIEDVFRVKPEYQIKEGKNRPVTAGELAKHGPLTFSPQFKTQSIVLSNQNRIAKLKDEKNGKIILLSERVVDCKSAVIKLKIASLSPASIQIGLCLKSQISQKSFKFEKTSPMHGTFFFSSNGFVYAHNDPASNNTKSNFLWKLNDELSVQVQQSQGKMLVKKKGETKFHELLLKIEEKDWEDLYFAVCLNGVGDKVQILG